MDKTEENIMFNLREMGFSLTNTDHMTGTTMRVEDLVVEILQKAREPRCVEGIPVLLAKNPVDFDYLLRRAEEEGLHNAVGWILDEARTAYDSLGIPYSSDLTKIVDECRAKTQGDDHFVGEGHDPSFEKYAKHWRGQVAKKWSVLFVSTQYEEVLKVYGCDRQE